MKNPHLRVPLAAAALVAAGLLRPAAQAPPAAPQQPSEISTTITGEGGAPPRFAVPDFVALSPDAETVDAAKTIGRVLYDDLAFEHEFLLVPRDVYQTVPPAGSMTTVPFDAWHELNVDGVVIGTVQKTAGGVRVDVRLFNVRSRRQAFGQEYTGSVASKRLYAHTIADQLHQTQRALRGVARTKLTFESDRDGARIAGTIENRGAKEIYIADYDGENQRRVTTGLSLNITPKWSPDGRSIAYTSYRHGGGSIFISHIYEGTMEELTPSGGENWLPAFSPDGTRIAFTSTRDGNSEIYVANIDGSNVRRLTNNPAIDVTPTWSPSGAQIAFTSDRGGSPQIYIMGADGLNVQRLTAETHCDRPTWSPAPYNEIAYASKTGPGNDIKVIDLATRTVRQLTFGEGNNESPAWAPNGRHMAFVSTRAGKEQVFTLSRTGQDLKQITRLGNNSKPDWSN